MNVNKWLTLISYKCIKKGSSQQQQTQQISTVNLISVTSICVNAHCLMLEVLRYIALNALNTV